MKTLKVSDKTTIIFGKRGEGKTNRLLELFELQKHKSLYLSTTRNFFHRRGTRYNIVSSFDRLSNYSRGTMYENIFIDEFLLMEGIKSDPQKFVYAIEKEFYKAENIYLTTDIENLKEFKSISNKEYAINK